MWCWVSAQPHGWQGECGSLTICPRGPRVTSEGPCAGWHCRSRPVLSPTVSAREHQKRWCLTGRGESHPAASRKRGGRVTQRASCLRSFSACLKMNSLFIFFSPGFCSLPLKTDIRQENAEWFVSFSVGVWLTYSTVFEVQNIVIRYSIRWSPTSLVTICHSSESSQCYWLIPHPVYFIPVTRLLWNWNFVPLNFTLSLICFTLSDLSHLVSM